MGYHYLANKYWYYGAYIEIRTVVCKSNSSDSVPPVVVYQHKTTEIGTCSRRQSAIE